MKKKILSLILIIMLFALLAVPAFAADHPRFIDQAGLLSESEAASLTDKLDSYSEHFGFDFVIVTLETLNGMDPEEAACYIYDEYGYGAESSNDGVILLINMGERDWAITSTGWGQTAINGDARSFLSNAFIGDLSAGNYSAAFNTFADKSARLVEQAQSGTVYKTPFNFVKSLIISLVISLIVALIVVSIMKGKLKTVQRQDTAANYVADGSLHLDVERDRYLYSNVARTPRAQNNSTRSSSGGSSHSSSSGKF